MKFGRKMNFFSVLSLTVGIHHMMGNGITNFFSGAFVTQFKVIVRIDPCWFSTTSGTPAMMLSQFHRVRVVFDWLIRLSLRIEFLPLEIRELSHILPR